MNSSVYYIYCMTWMEAVLLVGSPTCSHQCPVNANGSTGLQAIVLLYAESVSVTCPIGAVCKRYLDHINAMHKSLLCISLSMHAGMIQQ